MPLFGPEFGKASVRPGVVPNRLRENPPRNVEGYVGSGVAWSEVDVKESERNCVDAQLLEDLMG